MAQNEKAVRVRADLHEKIHAAARAEGRSAANYVEWVLRPIVDAALESAAREVSLPGRGSGRGGTGSGARPIRASRAKRAKVPARPKTRGRASQEWVGCSEHPDAGAVSVSGGRMACGEPGCANGARMASA